MDVYNLLKEMKEKDASDLHIISGIAPTFRIAGELRSWSGEKITPEQSKSLIYSLMTEEQKSEFKKKCELDFSLTMEGIGRFRINAHFQQRSVAAAIRLIPDRILSLSALNLPSILADLALRQKGLILVTGPAGCGKSTTLATMVEIINEKRSAHIIIVEDPIEYVHCHRKSLIEQREVGADTLSFSGSLRHSLRQDPDVILIGEMRDLDTIAIAITAAETGHLVLSTLHTPDAPQAIDRIVDVFPPYQQSQIKMQLSGTLQGIIAQILLPRKNGEGRVPAVELLIATPAVRNLIRIEKTHQLYTLMQTGAQFGMQTMDQSLKNLVKRGLISFETALSRARDPKGFQESLT
ncbi:type IV pili twitching motility protein PilT [Candidatus Aerophobetes bacterium Ae_b3b]|nr:MAG: type IV pili twitching motility protein PilT [Candidatus Aerophobetes bacterium Ae_b3b]